MLHISLFSGIGGFDLASEWLSNVKSQSIVGSWGQKHNLRKLDDDILERQIIVGNVYENPELLSEH